ESLLPLEISSSLREASLNHFLAKNVFMENGQFKLYKAVVCCFNDLYDSIPKVVSLKMTEEEHCKKEYKLSLYHANLEKEKPDLSCTINDIPILNSEIKPIRCTPLLQKKNYIKAQLKERRSINQQLKERGGPGLHIRELEAHRGYRNTCKRPSPTDKNDVIYLIGTHQNNLILVNCDEKTDAVTAGQVKDFQSEVSRYPANTLGIYVAKKVSINSLKHAKSSQNIIVTNLIELNNTVSSYFELKKNSEQMCELMMRRIDEL
ncbi:20960_t:CDS:2, partial [Gigaspora margarita]